MKSKVTMTMLTITTGFLAAGLIFRWDPAIYIALGTGITGIVSSFLSKWITWAWDKLGYILGLVIPKIILVLIFYIFLFPIAVLARLFRKDPLLLSNNYKSFFLERNYVPAKKDFEKTW